MGDKPGNNVGNVLVGHHLAPHVAAPIGSADGGPADDHGCAKALVAHQSEERAIHDGAGQLAAAAVHAVTRGAVDSIGLRAVLTVARLFFVVLRTLTATDNRWVVLNDPPSLLHPSDLFLCPPPPPLPPTDPPVRPH